MVNITEKNRSLIVEITGEIDHHSADAIKMKVDNAYRRKHLKHMLFDFGGVTFMDSSGIGMMIGRYKNVKKQGGDVIVANVNQDVRRIYQLSGLPKILMTFDTVDGALESISKKYE